MLLNVSSQIDPPKRLGYEDWSQSLMFCPELFSTVNDELAKHGRYLDNLQVLS